MCEKEEEKKFEVIFIIIINFRCPERKNNTVCSCFSNEHVCAISKNLIPMITASKSVRPFDSLIEVFFKYTMIIKNDKLP